MVVVHEKPEAGDPSHGISVIVFLADADADEPSDDQPTPSFSSSSSTAMNSSTDQLSENRHMFNCILPSRSKISLAESLVEAPMDAVAHVIGHHYGIHYTAPPPSPCTHPLLNKPQAREENVRGITTVLNDSTKTDTEDSVLTAARKKALLMTSTSSPLFRPVITRSIDSSGSLVTPAQVYTKALRVREVTAIEAAADHRYVQEWGFWLKCYSEGRFNLSRPPDPPPYKPDFTHLAAPPPPDEIERIKAFRRMSVPYPDWALKNARHLVVLAMRTLQTEHAALSFFDRKNEVMRAECGYNRAVIPRHESIGAHLLLSNDAMVILDAVKDWRLKGSSLVQDVPFIRFYAAAPLFTPEGHVVGAFSVFDSRPKDSFPLRLRQKLVNYARMAMADFRKVVDDDHTLKQSKSVSNYRTIVDDDHALPHSLNSSDTVRSDTIPWGDGGMLPSPDILQTRLAKQISAMSLGGGRGGASPVDGFSSEGQTVVDDVHTAVARNHVTSNSTNQTYNLAPVLLDQQQTSRRVQACLGHVHKTTKPPTPPESPTLPQQLSRASHESQSDHLFRGKVIPTQPGPAEMKRAPATIDTSPTKSPTHGNDAGPAPATLQLSPPISQHENSPQLSRSVEAAEIITLIAQTLNWDFVYILRVVPGYSEEAEASGGVHDRSFTQLVVSHGCPDPPPIFSYSLHVRALRSAGGLIYRDNGEDEGCTNRVGFKVGIMLPLSRDPVVPQSSQAKGKNRDSDESLEEKQSCQGGLILGAFKKKTPFDYEPSPEDIAALRESGYSLRLLLESAG